MRNPFKFGCLKPKTKDDDDSLLHYPGGGSSKVSGLNSYANGNVGGASSTAWQTPPLGKGAMRHLPPQQESPARKNPAHHQTDAWCTNCGARCAALELDLKKTKDDLEASKNSQGILKAKSRVLESICTGIRERYKALSLPPELALPEPEAVDVVADMTHPDQRAIGAAGRKVLAMFETISQFCQKAQQANTDLKTEVDVARAGQRFAEYERFKINQMNIARGQAIHDAKIELHNSEVENRILKDALSKALHDLGRDGDFEAYGYYGRCEDTPCQSLNPSQQNALSGRFKENEGSVQSPSYDGPPLRENMVNRAHYMSSSLSGEKLKALHQQKCSRATATTEGEELSGEVSFRQGQTVSIPAETSGRGQIGHAPVSEFSHSPLRPPVAVQRSPVRGHRRQLSTVAEEAYTPASAAAKRALPMLNLEPLTQQQGQYNGPQELYQSTVYTSEATEVRTSATASNFSDAAAQNGGQALLANVPEPSRQADYSMADSPATTSEPPLISFTPPRQAVAKLAKMFQPGPSRLSNSGKLGSSADGDVAASKHFSPLKHHIKAAHQIPASPQAGGAASRLAVGAGPRDSHLDFFLRDAAAATAKFRQSQSPVVGPLQKHIKASASAHGFFGNYESAVQQQQALVKSRASSVSSHSNPLFTSDPDDLDAQPDVQSALLPTVPEALNESAGVFESKGARTAAADQGVNKSVVASTSTRLFNRLPDETPAMEAGPQANQRSDQRVNANSATEADLEADEEDCTSRGKTPDTNVKLNQPLRCGRYGQDLISHKDRQQHSSQAEADREQEQRARLGVGGKVDLALIASRQSSTAPIKAPIRAVPVRVAQPQRKGSATRTVPPTVPLLAEPSQQPATMQPVRAVLNGPVAASGAVASGAVPDRTAPGGPPAARAPASVDDLLIGPSPVLPIMTASMAGEAAAMAVSAAALAKPTAANKQAVKAVLGQHYRQYRAKMAAAEQRNAIPPRKPQGPAGTTAPAKAAATAAVPAAAESANRGSEAGPSGQQHDNALPEYRQHHSQNHAAGAATAQESADAEDVPLRVKYGSSSSGSSSRASWQVSAVGLAQRQDTATTLYAQAQQPQQQKQSGMHDKEQQRPSRKGSRNADLRHGGNSASQQAQQERGPLRHEASKKGSLISQSTLIVATEGCCQVPGSQSGSAPQYANPEDVEIDFFCSNDMVGKVEDVRKSNDKLDMLLHSTVKRTQQGVLGKENQGLQGVTVASKGSKGPWEAAKALRDYRQ
ncbi:hypothetical protein WJX77_004703 [Trebouxia sp. C0004]